jgi:plastocyanin
MKKILQSFVLILTGLTTHATTYTITSPGFTFSPSTITIVSGDNIDFNIDGIHNVIEVSQATWNANGNTALPGGFQLPFGGGLLQASELPVGTHYYVCGPHASAGMKGIIIVQNTTGIEEKDLQPQISVFPNPGNGLLTIRSVAGQDIREYFITDQAGRKVFTGVLNGESTRADISRLRQGIYFIQITGQKRTSVRVIRY